MQKGLEPLPYTKRRNKAARLFLPIVTPHCISSYISQKGRCTMLPKPCKNGPRDFVNMLFPISKSAAIHGEMKNDTGQDRDVIGRHACLSVEMLGICLGGHLAPQTYLCRALKESISSHVNAHHIYCATFPTVHDKV